MECTKKYVTGKFYMVMLALDPDATQEWEQGQVPARFAGYDADGNETWNFLDAEPTQWPVRLAKEIAPTQP